MIKFENIKGLGVSVKELADKKINPILSLKEEVHIYNDTRCSEAQFAHFLNTSEFKYIFSPATVIFALDISGGQICLYFPENGLIFIVSLSNIGN